MNTKSRTSEKNKKPLFTRDEITNDLRSTSEQRGIVRMQVKKYQNDPKFALIFNEHDVQSELNFTVTNVLGAYEKFHEQKAQGIYHTHIRLDTMAEITGYFIASFKNAMVDLYVKYRSQKRGGKEYLMGDINSNREDDDNSGDMDSLPAANNDADIKISQSRAEVIAFLKALDKQQAASGGEITRLALLYVRHVNPRYKGSLEQIRRKMGMTYYVFSKHRMAMMEILKAEMAPECLDILGGYESNVDLNKIKSNEQKALRKMRYGASKGESGRYEHDNTCQVHYVFCQKMLKNGTISFTAQVTVDRIVNGAFESVFKRSKSIKSKTMTTEVARGKLKEALKDDIAEAEAVVAKRKSKHERYAQSYLSEQAN